MIIASARCPSEFVGFRAETAIIWSFGRHTSTLVFTHERQFMRRH
jgi:hypothetical protein